MPIFPQVSFISIFPSVSVLMFFLKRYFKKINQIVEPQYECLPVFGIFLKLSFFAWYVVFLIILSVHFEKKCVCILYAPSRYSLLDPLSSEESVLRSLIAGEGLYVSYRHCT